MLSSEYENNDITILFFPRHPLPPLYPPPSPLIRLFLKRENARQHLWIIRSTLMQLLQLNAIEALSFTDKRCV